MTRALALSLKLLARDWRAGELRLLAAALVIAVGAVTSVALFADRLQRGMATQSADLLGADLVLASPQPVDAQWIEAASERGLRHTRVLEFASVLVSKGQLKLANIRAVDRNYPLRGGVRTAESPTAERDTLTRSIPEPGTVWVEARLLYELGIEVGDAVTIGKRRFTVARVLTYEPGRGGSLFALAPRVLMSLAEVEATGVIQPGSRVDYGYGIAGEAERLAAYRAWLEPRLAPNHRLIDPREGNTAVGRALERVERYLGLTSLLAVLLAGAAVAMAARRYTARHYDTSALLRCLGSTQRDIVALYLPQLFIVALLASVAGGAVGFAAQGVIYFLLKELFPIALPPPGLAPFALGLLTGLIALVGFAVPPVLRLRQVPTMRVLRRELAPLPPGALAVYGSAAAAMAALLGYYTASAKLTAIVLGGALAAGALLAAAAYLLLAGGGLVPARAASAWRFGVRNLRRRARASVAQILAFGLGLLAIALVALVRTDLLDTWERKLSPDTPNYFAFNILAEDVERVERFFTGHQVATQALYPLVRGRLIEINGIEVKKAVTKEEGDDGALRRELNLTWSAALPPDNDLVAGSWWPKVSASPAVSVEGRLAKRLGIKLKDRLTFSIGGARLTATVTSLRKVEWESFHPNFFMIFAPGDLDAYPATYLTSFHLKPDQRPLVASLVREFPAISVLETEQVLLQVRRILAQVTVAVEFVLLFVLAAGLVVLYAAVSASLDERLQEGALLRALGASRTQLRSAQLAEFALLGAAAGLLAAIGSELIVWLLYTRVFDLPYAWKWPVWLAAPLAGAALIAAAGHLGTRRVLATSPIGVLREA